MGNESTKRNSFFSLEGGAPYRLELNPRSASTWVRVSVVRGSN